MKKLLAILLVAICFASCSKNTDLPVPADDLPTHIDSVGKFKLSVFLIATEHSDYVIDSLAYMSKQCQYYILPAEYNVSVNGKVLFDRIMFLDNSFDSIVSSSIKKGDTLSISGYSSPFAYKNDTDGNPLTFAPYNHLIVRYDGELKYSIHTKDTLNYTYIVE